MENWSPKTLIVGGGAVGSYVAARLIEKGVDATLLAGEARCDNILRRLLSVRSRFGRFHKPVNAIVASEISATYDLVVLACRAHRRAEALAQSALAIGPDTIVVSLLDGGPYGAELAERSPNNVVLDGMCEARVALDADGIVYHAAPEARIWVGARHAGDDAAERVAALLCGRGLIAMATNALPQHAWARSVYLAAGIGTTTMTGQPLRDAFRFMPGRTHFEHLMSDGGAIATQAGFDIDAATRLRYRHGISLEGEPIAAPPRLTDPRGAGAEARYLLAQMVARAEKLHVNAISLRTAFKLAGTTEASADAA